MGRLVATYANGHVSYAPGHVSSDIGLSLPDVPSGNDGRLFSQDSAGTRVHGDQAPSERN